MIIFVFIKCVVSFILIRGVYKPYKTSKFVPKMDFSWEQKVTALGGKKAPHLPHFCTLPAKGQEGCAPWGKNAPHTHFLGTNLEVLRDSRPL